MTQPKDRFANFSHGLDTFLVTLHDAKHEILATQDKVNDMPVCIRDEYKDVCNKYNDVCTTMNEDLKKAAREKQSYCDMKESSLALNSLTTSVAKFKDHLIRKEDELKRESLPWYEKWWNAIRDWVETAFHNICDWFISTFSNFLGPVWEIIGQGIQAAAIDFIESSKQKIKEQSGLPDTLRTALLKLCDVLLAVCGAGDALTQDASKMKSSDWDQCDDEVDKKIDEIFAARVPVV